MIMYNISGYCMTMIVDDDYLVHQEGREVMYTCTHAAVSTLDDSKRPNEYIKHGHTSITISEILRTRESAPGETKYTQ